MTNGFGNARAPRSRALLDGAANLVWVFTIQRELCGFRNWEAVVKDYVILPEVVDRVRASQAQG